MQNYLMFTFAIITLLIYVSATYPHDTHTGTKQDLIAPQIGTIAERVGYMSISDEYSLTSFVIRLPSLSSMLTIKGKDAEATTQCSAISKEFGSDLLDLLRFWQNELITYVSNRHKILFQYVTTFNVPCDVHVLHNVQKRGVLGLLTGGLASLAIGGITEFQLYKIRQHVTSNAEDTRQLKDELKHAQTEILALKNNLIGIVRNVTDTTSLFLQRQECSALLSYISMKLESRFYKFRTLVEDTLWSSLSGDNQMALNPKMIDLDSLRRIINQHSELNITIFTRQPYMVYTLSKISLLEISRDLSFAHFVLSIPTILYRAPMHPIYRVSQIGTLAGNKTCRYPSDSGRKKLRGLRLWTT